METAQRIFGRDWIKIQDMNSVFRSSWKDSQAKAVRERRSLDESIYGI